MRSIKRMPVLTAGTDLVRAQRVIGPQPFGLGFADEFKEGPIVMDPRSKQLGADTQRGGEQSGKHSGCNEMRLRAADRAHCKTSAGTENASGGPVNQLVAWLVVPIVCCQLTVVCALG